jgi:putative endopeptidase
MAGLVVVAISSCTPKTDSGPADVRVVKDDRESNLLSANFEYMDLSVDPSVDFYQYANGAWLKNNPVPQSETRYGSFNEVQDNNNAILKEILEAARKEGQAKGSTAQLLGDFYHSCLDTVQRNAAGMSVVADLIQQNHGFKNKQELSKHLAMLHLQGYSVLFGAYVEQDLKNNTRHALYLGQAGLGLPNRDYYFRDDEHYQHIRKEYQEHISRSFELAGEKGNQEGIFNLETSLAEHSMGPVELRDIAAQYNEYSLADLEKLTPSIDWKLYFTTLGTTVPDTVIVGQPAFFTNLNKVIGTEYSESLRNYLDWQVIEGSSGFLTTAMEREHFIFYGKTIRGQKQMKEDWKRAIDVINRSALDEALGKAFVEKAFSPEAREKVYRMVDDLMAAFKDRIEKLEWMTEGTRKAALDKLARFTRKLGYPDKWTDYSSLSISRNSYASNVLACRVFSRKKNLAYLGKPIDREKWEMPPHIVNAYYNPLLNEIVFPAGILQPPFFDSKAEDAVNYARMGAVIGHEFTHGFDDQGAQFMADGTFNNWWQEQDLIQFQSRTQRLVNQYNRFQPIPGVFVNGKLTLGENIADFGGLTVAYYAFKRTLKGKESQMVNGFTPEQRFFIAFAQIWKSNATEQALRHQVDTDPHSPAKFRVNGSLSNMPEFFQAFGIKDGTPMRQPEEEIAVIW